MAQRTVKLGSFTPGVNNRREPTKLSTVLPDRSRGTYLYGADNLDLSDDSYLKRRQGTTAVFDEPAHSVWSDARGAYSVVGGNLYQLTLNGDTLLRVLVRENLPQVPISYARGADNDVYWSNGQTIRRIVGTQDLPIATPAPDDPAPSDITTGAGGLPEGRYLVAFTANGPDGESPATTPVQVNVQANGAILLTGQHHIYMSGPNGDILTYQGFGDRVYTHTDSGRACATLNTAVMPAGRIVSHYNGRMLVASGSTLYLSMPYNYGLYAPASGYIPFPETITILAPTDNGLYICTDRTYWVSDPQTTDLQEVLPYGGIMGTMGRSPSGENVFWQTPRGLVLADQNMSVKNLQEEALDFAAAASGASMYRERDGMTHIVTSRAGVEANTAMASSFAEAEIVRAGTKL